MRRRLILSSSILWLLVLGGAGCDPGGEIGQPETRNLPSCPDAQCTGGIGFAADLMATAADALNLELSLCRNDLCSTLRPTADGTEFACDFFGPLTGTCRIRPSAGSLHLEITFAGDMNRWAVGDTFYVRVGIPGMKPLTNMHKTIVDYTKTYPAGADCEPVCWNPIFG